MSDETPTVGPSGGSAPTPSAPNRLLAGVFAAALVFVTAVEIYIAINLLSRPVCGDAMPGERCFDLTATQRFLSSLLSGLSGLLAAAAVLLALSYAVRGTGGGWLRRSAGMAMALGVLSLVVARI